MQPVCTGCLSSKVNLKLLAENTTPPPAYNVKNSFFGDSMNKFSHFSASKEIQKTGDMVNFVLGRR